MAVPHPLPPESPALRASVALAEAFAQEEPAAGRRTLLIAALRAAHEVTNTTRARRLLAEATLDRFLSDHAGSDGR